MAKKIAIWFMGLLAALCLLYFSLGGASGLLAKWLPALPEYPQPMHQLEEHQQGRLFFNSRSPFDLDVLLAEGSEFSATTSYGDLHLPTNATQQHPVPVMVLLTGSSGLGTGREEAYVEMLLKAGVGVFVLDYYGSRGLTPDMHYMAKLFAVSEIDALSDAYSALSLLKKHPAVKANKIGLSGFSYGGMAIRLGMDHAVQMAFSEPDGFAAFVDFYGPCFQVPEMLKTNGAPLLTLRGDNDGSNVLSDCQNREQEIEEAGSKVEAHVFRGAPHAWDITDHPAVLWPDSPYIANCEVKYNALGQGLLKGQPLVMLPIDAERSERVLARFLSQLDLMDCLQYGYVSGQDTDAMNLSTPIYMEFIKRNLL